MATSPGSSIAQWQRLKKPLATVRPIPIYGCKCSDIDHNLRTVTQLLQLGWLRERQIGRPPLEAGRCRCRPDRRRRDWCRSLPATIAKSCPSLKTEYREELLAQGLAVEKSDHRRPRL